MITELNRGLFAISDAIEMFSNWRSTTPNDFQKKYDDGYEDGLRYALELLQYIYNNGNGDDPV